jgi:(p)ppGpp synthase/HD superfamily hydrolase
MLDSFEIKEILEGFRKRLEVFPDFHRDKKLVEKAVDFALEAHKNQFRKYS